MSSRRVDDIDNTLKAIESGWPFFISAIQALVDEHIERLVTANNEETRGRIKALRELMDLPETLKSERAGILAAELPDEGSAL